jgi:hypothetical protein
MGIYRLQQSQNVEVRKNFAFVENPQNKNFFSVKKLHVLRPFEGLRRINDLIHWEYIL